MAAREAQILEIDWDSFGDELGAQGLRDLMRDIYRGYHARAVVSEVNQQLAAKRLQDARVSPLGMHVDMTVDALDFHYWATREGPECWGDDQFIREKKRDVPATAVKASTGRTMITVPGMAGN